MQTVELKKHLCIEDHVDALVDNVLGMVAKELEDMLNLGLIRESAQSDAVFAGAGSDELLGNNSHGRDRRDTGKKRSLQCSSTSTTSSTRL